MGLARAACSAPRWVGRGRGLPGWPTALGCRSLSLAVRVPQCPSGNPVGNPVGSPVGQSRRQCLIAEIDRDYSLLRPFRAGPTMATLPLAAGLLGSGPRGGWRVRPRPPADRDLFGALPRQHRRQCLIYGFSGIFQLQPAAVPGSWRLRDLFLPSPAGKLARSRSLNYRANPLWLRAKDERATPLRPQQLL